MIVTTIPMILLANIAKKQDLARATREVLAIRTQVLNFIGDLDAEAVIRTEMSRIDNEAGNGFMSRVNTRLRELELRETLSAA